MSPGREAEARHTGTLSRSGLLWTTAEMGMIWKRPGDLFYTQVHVLVLGLVIRIISGVCRGGVEKKSCVSWGPRFFLIITDKFTEQI